MAYNYERDTRDHYKSEEVAQRYHTAFSGRGWRGERIRARWVAARERRIVKRFLERVPHDTMLDIPAGTGKMAPVFSSLTASVVACDISEAMLNIARNEYKRLNYSRVRFVVCDAERITESLGALRFDTVLCLRLLHRVPATVKRNILAQLAAMAEYAIVSFGSDSLYQQVRRQVRSRILGGDRRGTSTLESLPSIHEKVNDRFDVLDQAWVSPYLSQEVIFLLRAK